MYLMRFTTPSGISPARLRSSVTSRTAMYNSRMDCRVSLNAATKWFRSLCSFGENLIGGGATLVGAASGNFSAIDMVVGVGVNVSFCDVGHPELLAPTTLVTKRTPLLRGAPTRARTVHEQQMFPPVLAVCSLQFAVPHRSASVRLVCSQVQLENFQLLSTPAAT